MHGRMSVQWSRVARTNSRGLIVSAISSFDSFGYLNPRYVLISLDDFDFFLSI